MLRRVHCSYRRFGKTCLFHFQELSSTIPSLVRHLAWTEQRTFQVSGVQRSFLFADPDSHTHSAPQTDVTLHAFANTHVVPLHARASHLTHSPTLASQNTRFTNWLNTGEVTSFVTPRSRLQSAALLNTLRCADGSRLFEAV